MCLFREQSPRVLNGARRLPPNPEGRSLRPAACPSGLFPAAEGLQGCPLHLLPGHTRCPSTQAQE